MKVQVDTTDKVILLSEPVKISELIEFIQGAITMAEREFYVLKAEPSKKESQ